MARNRAKLIARVPYPMKMKGPDGGAREAKQRGRKRRDSLIERLGHQLERPGSLTTRRLRC